MLGSYSNLTKEKKVAELCLINDAPRSEIIATVAPAVHDIFSGMSSGHLPELTISQASAFADSLIKKGWLFVTKAKAGPVRFANLMNQSEVAGNFQDLGSALYDAMGLHMPKLSASQCVQATSQLTARSVGVAVAVRPGQLG